MDRASLLTFNPFTPPMGRLPRCPRPGCDGGLVCEQIGDKVNVTCMECDFRELHGLTGLVDQMARAARPVGMHAAKLAGAARRARPARALPRDSPDPLGPPCTSLAPPLLSTHSSAPPNQELLMPRDTDADTCSIAGCESPPGAGQGLCTIHYQRWGRCGKPDLDQWRRAGGPGAREWRNLMSSSDGGADAAGPSAGALPAAPSPADPVPAAPVGARLSPDDIVKFQRFLDDVSPRHTLSIRVDGGREVHLAGDRETICSVALAIAAQQPAPPA